MSVRVLRRLAYAPRHLLIDWTPRDCRVDKNIIHIENSGPLINCTTSNYLNLAQGDEIVEVGSTLFFLLLVGTK